MTSWRFAAAAALVSALTLGADSARGEDAAATGDDGGPVSFYRQIQPILRQHCQGCHQPAKAGGKFVLTTHSLLMSTPGDETVVVPGKPGDSILIEEITPEDGKSSMPKDSSPLAAHELALITRWIAEGAKDDTPESERVQYSSENPPSYDAPPVVTGLDYSPDGTYLAVTGSNEVILHRADGSEIVARLIGLSERLESVRFSPDGKLLAVTGGSPARSGEVQIWDVEKRKLALSYPVTFDTVYGASWSADGTRVAFGCADNTVRAIDVTKGEQILFQGAHSDWVLGTTFSKDSSHLVSVSRDRSMKLIVVATEQFVDNITSITPGALEGGLIAVDRHPEKDELLVGGADGRPKFYRMHREKARKIGDDYNLIRAFERMPGRIFDVEFSPDGKRLAAGSSLNRAGEVRVYQSDDGKLVSKFESKRSTVYAVTFSADGARVAAAGFDGMVRVIDAASGELLTEFVSVPFAARKVSF